MSEFIRYRAHPEIGATQIQELSPSIFAAAKHVHRLERKRDEQAKAIPGETEKSKRFHDLLEIFNKSISSTYPNSYTLNSGEIHFLTQDGLKDVFESSKPAETFTPNALALVGAVNSYKQEYDPNLVRFHDWHYPTPQIYLRNDEFGKIDSDYVNARTWGDFIMMKELATDALMHSRIPKSLNYDDDMLNLLLNRLSFDQKFIPKIFPNTDRDKFAAMVENYELMLREEEEPEILADGSSLLFCTYMKFGDGTRHSEVIHGTGQMLNLNTVELLAETVVAEALKGVAKTYPQKFLVDARKRFQRLLKDNHPKDEKETRAFYESIGVVGNRKIYESYYNSETVQKFLDIKKRKPNLTYPS